MNKEVWIGEKVKWDPIRRYRLQNQNKYKGHAYVVCSSPQAHWMYEIVETHWLCAYYQNATLFAVCHNKKQAVEQIVRLIDSKYNQPVG